MHSRSAIAGIIAASAMCVVGECPTDVPLDDPKPIAETDPPAPMTRQQRRALEREMMKSPNRHHRSDQLSSKRYR
jgi:hypothetical protein